MEHDWFQCFETCQNPDCPFCMAGEKVCKECGCGGGIYTTECPGELVTLGQLRLISTGVLDFIGGQWVDSRKAVAA